MGEKTLTKTGCAALQAKYPKRRELVAALYVEHEGDSESIHAAMHASMQAEMDEKDAKIKALSTDLAEKDKVIECLKAEKDDGKDDEEDEAKAEKLRMAKVKELDGLVAKVQAEIGVLKAAKGAREGVEHQESGSGEVPKTLTRAMEIEMRKSGGKLKGQALRDHCVTMYPDIERK